MTRRRALRALGRTGLAASVFVAGSVLLAPPGTPVTTPAWAQSPVPTPSSSPSRPPSLPPVTRSPTPTPEVSTPQPAATTAEPTPSPTRRPRRRRTSSPAPVAPRPPDRPAQTITAVPDDTWTPAADDVSSDEPDTRPKATVATGSSDRLRYYGFLVLSLALLLGAGGITGLVLTRETRPERR